MHERISRISHSTFWPPLRCMTSSGTLACGLSGSDLVVHLDLDPSSKRGVLPTSTQESCCCLQEGDVQLWGLATGSVKLLDSLPCADCITAVATFATEPYVLLGCESGTMQVLALTGSTGVLTEVAPPASTALMPYEGEVVSAGGAGY